MTSKTARLNAAARQDAGRISGVMIGTPTLGNMVTAPYARSLAATMAALERSGIQADVALHPNIGLLEFERASITARFLSWDGGSHLVFVDADQEWSADDFLKLIAHPQEVVAGLVPIRGEHPPRLNFFSLRAEDGRGYVRHDPVTGLVEVQAVGTAFLSIKRSALLRMTAAYPELKIRHTGWHPEELLPFFYDLFRSGVDETTGIWVSEDIAFCKRWRSIGGQIFADPSLRVAHHVSAVLEVDPREQLGLAPSGAQGRAA